MPRETPRYIKEEQEAAAKLAADKAEEERLQRENSFFSSEQGPLEKERADKEKEVEEYLKKFSQE